MRLLFIERGSKSRPVTNNVLSVCEKMTNVEDNDKDRHRATMRAMAEELVDQSGDAHARRSFSHRGRVDEPCRYRARHTQHVSRAVHSTRATLNEKKVRVTNLISNNYDTRDF